MLYVDDMIPCSDRPFTRQVLLGERARGAAAEKAKSVQLTGLGTRYGEESMGIRFLDLRWSGL